MRMTLIPIIAVLLGCRDPRPVVSGCPTGVTSCIDNTPHYCSPEQRWTPKETTACSNMYPAVTCCVTRSYSTGRPIHACAPVGDCLPDEAYDSGLQSDATQEGGTDQ